MAWWDDLRDATSAAVEAAAAVVETAATAAGDVVADVVETAGNALQDGANAARHSLTEVPGAGSFLAAAFVWAAGNVAAAGSLVGASVKATAGIIAGVGGGLIRIVGGTLCLDGSLILKGLIDVGSSVVGAYLIVLAKAAAMIQHAVFAQANERPLSKLEYELLRDVFHSSLSLYNIRVVDGASGIFGITTSSAVTIGNTVYANSTDFSASPEILVHECVHVWQYQILGPRYTMDALGAQAIYGRDPSPTNAYSWIAELDRGHARWDEFNKEAAAEHIEDIWEVGSMTPLPNNVTPGNGAFFLAGFGVFLTNAGRFEFGGRDYSALAIASVDALRNGFNIRPSKYLYA